MPWGPTVTPDSCTKSASRPPASEQSRNVGPLAALAVGTPSEAVPAANAPNPTSIRILHIACPLIGLVTITQLPSPCERGTKTRHQNAAPKLPPAPWKLPARIPPRVGARCWIGL